MPKSKVFKKLYSSVVKTYLGKPVKAEYRAKYGKRYDKKEIESIAIAIAKKRHIGGY
jgi:hypothetical protein